MKTCILLRVLSLVALLQGLAHGTMHVTYSPRHGPAEVALVEAMQSHHFTFGGFDRTYWDFYFGYGLFAAWGCVVQAAVLWLLATLARTEPARLQRLLAVLAFANLGYAVLVLRYFFLLPAMFDFALAAGLVLALVSARTQPPPVASILSTQLRRPTNA